jgi:hypothetical protein
VDAIVVALAVMAKKKAVERKPKPAANK